MIHDDIDTVTLDPKRVGPIYATMHNASLKCSWTKAGRVTRWIRYVAAQSQKILEKQHIFFQRIQSVHHLHSA